MEQKVIDLLERVFGDTEITAESSQDTVSEWDSMHQLSIAFEIEFNDEVVKEESKYTLDSRNIFLKIKKKTSGPYWPRLTKDNVKYQWIQVDWAYYTEEDEEGEVAQPNFDGQDFGDLGGEMDEDDEPPKDECGCGHDHDHAHEHAHEHQEGDKKEEGNADKKADLSDLDKEQ